VKILLGALGAALVVVLGVLGWMGALSSVEVAERDMGPYQFVYVHEASTDFEKIGRITESLGQRLEAAGFDQRKPAQEYFPAGRGMQNRIGFVVQRMVSAEVLGAETFYQDIPVRKYMVAEFPFRNPMSFAVGHLRVNPAFEAHLKKHSYAQTSALVILDGDRIVYLSPIGAS